MGLAFETCPIHKDASLDIRRSPEIKSDDMNLSGDGFESYQEESFRWVRYGLLVIRNNNANALQVF